MLLSFYNYRVFYCGMSVVIIKNDDTATAMTAKYREVKIQDQPKVSMDGY